MTYVLDTNVVIAALNSNERVSDRLRFAAVDEIIIPVVVVAELLYGAHRSSRRSANLARVRGLRERFRVAA